MQTLIIQTFNLNPATRLQPLAHGHRSRCKTIRTTARDFANPVDYQHPYPSLARYAITLALSYDANRTGTPTIASCG